MTEPLDETCRGVFNRLSGVDRVFLYAAAVSESLTGIMRDDVTAYPWKYPLYIAHMAAFWTPVIGWGVMAVSAAAAWGYAKYGPEESWIRDRLNRSVDDRFVQEKYSRYIRHDSAAARPNVDYSALMKDFSRHAWTDVHEATSQAWAALCRRRGPS